MVLLDPDYALAQARSADRLQKEGNPSDHCTASRWGKSIIDTADMPTENGTVLHAGRQPTEDATVVCCSDPQAPSSLGKRLQTELAVYTPGKTRNPHNPDHTPGDPQVDPRLRWQ